MARGEGRDGRGLSLARRIKELYRKAWEKSPQGAWEASGVPMFYETGIAWDDFHRPSEYHGTPE